MLERHPGLCSAEKSTPNGNGHMHILVPQFRVASKRKNATAAIQASRNLQGNVLMSVPRSFLRFNEVPERPHCHGRAADVLGCLLRRYVMKHTSRSSYHIFRSKPKTMRVVYTEDLIQCVLQAMRTSTLSGSAYSQ